MFCPLSHCPSSSAFLKKPQSSSWSQVWTFLFMTYIGSQVKIPKHLFQFSDFWIRLFNLCSLFVFPSHLSHQETSESKMTGLGYVFFWVPTDIFWKLNLFPLNQNEQAGLLIRHVWTLSMYLLMHIYIGMHTQLDSHRISSVYCMPSTRLSRQKSEHCTSVSMEISFYSVKSIPRFSQLLQQKLKLGEMQQID